MGYFYRTGKSWRLTIYKNGQRKNLDLGRDFNKAQVLRNSIERSLKDEKQRERLVNDLAELGLVENGVRPAKAESEVEWKAAVEKVLEHMRQIGRRPQTVAAAESALKRFEAAFHPEKPSDVTPEMADQWIAQLQNSPNSNDRSGQKKLGPAGVHSLIRSASTCFTRWARWRWITQNPFLNCDKPTVPLTMPKPFKPEDLDGLLAACNRPLARCLSILVHSGMRPDELIHLRWRKYL